MIRQAFPIGNTADGGLGSDKIFPYVYNLVSDQDNADGNFNVIAGTATVVLGDVLRQINGVGTLFLTDLAIGDCVQVGSEYFVIQSITNDLLAIATTIPLTNQIAQPVLRQRVSSGIGPVVAFGQSASQIIKLRPDYNFIPRWLSLTCYFINAGSFEWWDTPPTSPILFQNRLSDMGQPLSSFIMVEMNVFPDSRFMIGGAIMNATNTNSVIPVPLIQGEESGLRGIPQPYLLPANGHIQLRFTNIHASKNIIVGGCVFGWKVRI